MNIKKLAFIAFVVFISLDIFAKNPVVIPLSAQSGLMTKTIQDAIDSCASKGGGMVIFPSGKYISGGIELKCKVSLQFEKGAILQGSDKYVDYQNDAFIFGKDLSEIAIQGEGIIDGEDCYNPIGEEGFRGPHCIGLINCENILLEGFTIKNSANWAINCRYCSNAKVDKVSIRGGHDGLHTRFCSNFIVADCDFRTGDDCFAGNDNLDFSISGCQVNTSCSGFRLGCLHLLVKDCRIWGPGEYAHRIRNEKRLPTAFVHFSPSDEPTKIESGNWLIENVVVDSVEHFYWYNHKDGLWQTGQPASNIKFKDVKATGVQNAFYITDDADRRFSLTLKNCSFKELKGIKYQPDEFEGVKILSPAFFYANNFDQISLSNVTFEQRDENYPLLECMSGKKVILNKVHLVSDNNAKPYSFDKITLLDTIGLYMNGKPIKIE